MLTLLRRPRRSVRDYYANPRVRQRMREYAGLLGDPGGGAVFLAAQGPPHGRLIRWEDAEFLRPSELDRVLDDGLDVTRSMRDRGGLFLLLDLDYWNADRLDEPFTHPVETFFKLEPVRDVVREVLVEHGMPTMEVMTGQGYHYAGLIPFHHPAFGELAALAPECPAWLDDDARRAPAWAPAPVGEPEARAATGLGMVMERFADLVVRRGAARCEIPLVVDATRVGIGPVGRECVSVDLSAFSDPLSIRHTRIAFSTYQRHVGPPVGPATPGGRTLAPLAAIPRGQQSLLAALEIRGDLEMAGDLAEVATAAPPVTEGMSVLIRSYRDSAVRLAHERFYAEPVNLDRARDDRRRLLGERLPPCVDACLRRPNDLLLRPEHLQNLTRYLGSLDWTPRRIAALVENVYREDHGWGDRWTRMEPRTRAETYVRGFAALIESGADRMVDFNCVSTREKGLCPGGGCGFELGDARDRLLGARP